MKQQILIIACFSLLINLAGCRQYDKSKIIEQYKFDEDISVLNEKYPNGLGVWLKEGTICYGILLVRDENKLPIRMKEVQAKVINVHSESVKMEALEDVAINRTIECNKVTLKKGECWDEVDGELFKTREEAIRFIDEKYPGLRMKD